MLNEKECWVKAAGLRGLSLGIKVCGLGFRLLGLGLEFGILFRVLGCGFELSGYTLHPNPRQQSSHPSCEIPKDSFPGFWWIKGLSMSANFLKRPFRIDILCRGCYTSEAVLGLLVVISASISRRSNS